MKVTRSVAMLAVLGAPLASVPVLATPLPPNTSLTKMGAGLASPNYTAGLPSYFTPGNLVQTLVAPMTLNFSGTVTSQVYSNNVGGFTFAYTFQNNGVPVTGADLVRGTFNPSNWKDVTITNAGSDASGASTSTGTSPVWSDGDPYLIGRADAGSGGYPFFQWRVGNAGTVIGPGGDRSAVVWLETTTGAMQTNTAGLLDGGEVGRANVLVPSVGPVVIPAPGAVVLGLIGLGLVGWARRRRR